MDKGFGAPKIAVVGVGGCGGNTVDHLAKFGTPGADLIALNTDMQDLNKIDVPKKIVLGPNVTRGLGAGMKPELGAKAMEDSLDTVLQEVKDAHMVFLVAGLGGGTGSGALPVLAKTLSSEYPDILTLAIVTTPYQYEVGLRHKIAQKALEDLKDYVDSYIVLDNNDLMSIHEQKKMREALEEGSMMVYRSVKGILDIITYAGLINVDFQDVRTVLEKSGRTFMGIGFAEGQDRAIQAVEKAIQGPFFKSVSLRGARGILVNILYDEDEPEVREVNSILEYIAEEVSSNGSEPMMAYGIAQVEGLGAKIQVTLVASNISDTPSQTLPRDHRTIQRPRPRKEEDHIPKWRRGRRELPPYHRLEG